MTRRRSKEQRETEMAVRAWNERLRTQMTLAFAVVFVDLGWVLSLNEAELTVLRVVGMVIHALVIGILLYLWLPFSIQLAGRFQLSPVVVEGLLVLVLALLVAGIEFGILHGPGRLAHTVTAAIGLVAGWAMRKMPFEPEGRRRKR